MDANTAPATAEAYAARNLQGNIIEIAGRLERLSGDIRRRAHDAERIGQPGCKTYGQMVGRITHEIMTTLALLNLNSLSTHATEADIARAKGE